MAVWEIQILDKEGGGIWRKPKPEEANCNVKQGNAAAHWESTLRQETAEQFRDNNPGFRVRLIKADVCDAQIGEVLWESGPKGNAPVGKTVETQGGEGG